MPSKNQCGGAKKKKCPSGCVPKKSTKSKKKRKLNPYFKKMLAAKKANKASFEYNGKTYVGKKHPRLGMIYKAK